MTRAIAQCCFKDFLPFSNVNKEGFREVIKTAMDIGYEYLNLIFIGSNLKFRAKRGSSIEIDSLIAERTTISRNVVAMSENYIQEAAPKILQICRNHGGAFSIDYGKD